MNKKLIKIFLVFVIFFIFTNNVQAISSGEIDKKISEYNSYKEKLSKLDCTNENDADVVHDCNTYRMQRNSIVTELMRLNEHNEIPKAKQSAVTKIIKENEDHCGKIFDDDFTKMINTVMKLFYIIGPILLILFGTLDYSKVVIASSQDALKKANQRFFRRIIATILLFLTPALTNLILSLNVSKYYVSGNAYACDLDFVIYKKQYEVKVLPQTQSSSRISGGSGGSGTTVSGINFSTNYSGMIYKGGPLPIPFPVEDFHTGSGFGPRTPPTAGASSFHRGVDLTATYNGGLDVPILAVADGTVVTTYGSCVARGDGCNGGAGNYVIISHNINGNTFNSVYMHMKSAPLVSVGDQITAGTQIGIQGSTGTSTGEHLHFGISVGGNYVDPYPYITGKSSS